MNVALRHIAALLSPGGVLPGTRRGHPDDDQFLLGVDDFLRVGGVRVRDELDDRVLLRCGVLGRLVNGNVGGLRTLRYEHYFLVALGGLDARVLVHYYRATRSWRVLESAE